MNLPAVRNVVVAFETGSDYSLRTYTSDKTDVLESGELHISLGGETVAVFASGKWIFFVVEPVK